MNEETYTATAAFLSNDIQRPPRNPPECRDDEMILSGEYYLDAHRNEIICHQVWTGKTDRGINKVVIWTNQGHGWINGRTRPDTADGNTNFTPEEARLRWNHAVDNGATRVYMRVKSKQSSKYGGITADALDQYLKSWETDYKSYKELAKEDRVWENYALEA